MGEAGADKFLFVDGTGFDPGLNGDDRDGGALLNDDDQAVIQLDDSAIGTVL